MLEDSETEVMIRVSEEPVLELVFFPSATLEYATPASSMNEATSTDATTPTLLIRRGHPFEEAGWGEVWRNEERAIPSGTAKRTSTSTL